MSGTLVGFEEVGVLEIDDLGKGFLFEVDEFVSMRGVEVGS